MGIVKRVIKLPVTCSTAPCEFELRLRRERSLNIANYYTGMSSIRTGQRGHVRCTFVRI